MTTPVVLVLAGGASNRFWPLRDKPLFEFGDYTLLERHLRALRDAGYERFVVVARPETATTVSSLSERLGQRIDVVVQAEARGMADAVLAAREAVPGDSPLYVTQAQDLVDGALHSEMLSRFERSPAENLIAGVRVSGYFPGGYLTLEKDRITSIVEKPGAGNEPSDLVNLVAHVFASTRSLMDALTAEAALEGADDVYERALSKLMQRQTFRVVPYEGRWQALKFPWQVLDVMDYLLERWTAGLESPGSDYEQREDGVFVGRDVKLFPGSYVVGPALLGHGAVVGQTALVRGSIIGENSVVGFGSEIARSYLASGVELHHNYVGDSVFDRHSSMGYGAVTANFRLDGRTVPMFVGKERLDTGRMKLGLILGEGSKLGVNSSTMPGIKIGRDVIVGPNLAVKRDLPEGARYLTERSNGRV